MTDATLLAPFADATFYIVRYDMTPKLYLTTIADFVRNRQFNSLNIIFNGVDYKNSSEYGYGYGYGKEGYYADDQKQTLLKRLFSKVGKGRFSNVR